MPGNTFGKLFRVTTWGESHGPAVGAVIDGCPPGIGLAPEDVQHDLDRRRPGGRFASPRKEPDRVEILSGVFEGRTTGTPISLMVRNRDVRSRDYNELAQTYRPGHADRTFEQKYGFRDWRGGGRSSARETVGRVAAGAVARRFLEGEGVTVRGYTLALGSVACDRGAMDLDRADENPFFCPDLKAAQAMEELVAQVRSEGDSLGGLVEVIAWGLPPGLGEPVFDKLDARLGAALFSIGAVKGVEIGSGFQAAGKRGSENNDPVTREGYASNHAGGVLGGLSSGMELVVRVAVKPIPSISKEQATVDRDGTPRTIRIGGRHDVSAVPRIVPVCEAMVLLTLADFMLFPYPYRLKHR